jgi:hypothetical protein
MYVDCKIDLERVWPRQLYEAVTVVHVRPLIESLRLVDSLGHMQPRWPKSSVTYTRGLRSPSKLLSRSRRDTHPCCGLRTRYGRRLTSVFGEVGLDV